MGSDDTTAPQVHPEPSAGAGREERLKQARHDVRGSLGVVQGALQTALDKDLTLSLKQRIELASIAKQALPELAVALDDYIAIMQQPAGDIRLPE